MSKDSQPDNKKARKKKSNNQTSITQENMNHNRNTKKQSAKPRGFWVILTALFNKKQNIILLIVKNIY